MISIYLRSNFSGALRKMMLFLQEGCFSRSRSSKVIIVGANRKRVRDFLFVRNSNLGPILHRFGDFAAFMCSWPHPYSTLILGVFPLHQMLVSARAETLSYSAVKLFSKYSKRCEKHTATSRTDGQTDQQTTCNLISALCVASRGKNQYYLAKISFRIFRTLSRVREGNLDNVRLSCFISQEPMIGNEANRTEYFLLLCNISLLY